MRTAAGLLLIITAMTATACTTTFGGAVVVFGFGDLLGYIFLSLLFAGLIALLGAKEKRHRNFWLWFVLNIVLSPLAGLIFLIVKISRRRRPSER